MARASRTAPLTGDEYLESLRDGRAVYIDGETRRRRHRAPGVPELGALDRAPVRRAPRPRAARRPCSATTASESATHRFFMPSYSAEELLVAREAIAAWARLSYGFMGRTPDYKASFMATLGAAPEFYAPFEASAEAWYRSYAEHALFLNHVLINPPIDRNREVHEVEDVYVHVVKERDDGMVVSRREDARDRLGADACHVRRAEQRRPAREGEGRGLRARVHRADGHARQDTDLAAIVRAQRDVAVGQSAL